MFAESQIVCTGNSSIHKPSYSPLFISYLASVVTQVKEQEYFVLAEHLNKYSLLGEYLLLGK